MNRDKVTKIFDLIERMSNDIDQWMSSANLEGWNVDEGGMQDSRALLEEAGAVLQEWKS